MIQDYLVHAVPFYYVVIAALVLFAIGCMAGSKADLPEQMNRSEYCMCVMLIWKTYYEDKSLANKLVDELDGFCNDLKVTRAELSKELMAIVDEVVKE